eukprot:3519709-Pyramimonas_sp.AAC.1
MAGDNCSITSPAKSKLMRLAFQLTPHSGPGEHVLLRNHLRRSAMTCSTCTSGMRDSSAACCKDHPVSVSNCASCAGRAPRMSYTRSGGPHSAF